MDTTKTPELAAALAQAIRDMSAVAPDRRNDFHRYSYTSAEAMLSHSRGPLSKNDLSIVPTGAEIIHVGTFPQPTDKNGKEQPDQPQFMLRRKLLLMHSSGESVELGCDWPIVPEKGRPLDKAAGAADTASMKYLLRTLLLIPRVEEDEEMDARRDDHRHQHRNGGSANGNGATPRFDPVTGDERKAFADVAKRLDGMDEFNAWVKRNHGYETWDAIPRKTLRVDIYKAARMAAEEREKLDERAMAEGNAA